MRRLPRRQMEYVVLRHDSGSTDAEIAETLGLGTGTVKKHLHRASRTLATSLEHVR